MTERTPMTSHDPDGWRPHPPQHAVSSSWIAPASRHAHRALRLFVTAGTWGAGICLLIGLMVFLATVIGPRHGADLPVSDRHTASPPSPQAVSRTSPGERRPAKAAIPAPQPTAVRHELGKAAAEQPAPPPRHPAYRLLAAFAGSGNVTTRPFGITAGRSWQLRWSYACPADRAGGSFSLRDATKSLLGRLLGPDSLLGPDVVHTGPAGHGAQVLLYPGTVQHYLIVVSTCAWTVQVTTAQ
jgi:hypothetical protein